MPEKIHITVADMMEAIGVCEQLAREFDPVVSPVDCVATRPQSPAEARQARALRLAAELMRTSIVGTITVSDLEVRHG